MILRDLIENMTSYHFGVRIIKDGKTSKIRMYDSNTNAEALRGAEDMEVVDVHARNEIVEQDSNVTHSTMLRPYIVVVVEV